MEAQEDQLQESGVRYSVNLNEMSIAQLEREVRILADRKRKNEENVSEELLATKYAKAYEELCKQLTSTRGELVARYAKLTRELYEMMADSAYGEFHQLEGQDAVVQALNAAFWSCGECPWELYPDVRELFERYENIKPEDDDSWAALTGRANDMLKAPDCTELKKQMVFQTVAELERIARKRCGK